MAAPAFEDVPPLRSIDSALLEAIRAQRELYLPAQRSANDLCRLKRGSARHQFMAESRERMLATLHRHSAMAHTALAKSRRPSFKDRLKRRKSDQVDQQYDFDTAYGKEADLEEGLRQGKADAEAFERMRPSLETASGQVESLWTRLNELYVGLDLNAAQQGVSRLLQLETLLQEAVVLETELNELIPVIDRGRRCVSSAFAHFKYATDLTGYNRDSGIFKSWWPDVSKPSALSTAVEESTITEICLTEARKILPTPHLPPQLAKVDTCQAKVIGDMHYLSQGGGSDRAGRTHAAFRQQIESCDHLRAAAVHIQNDEEELKDQLAIVTVQVGERRLALEEERWAIVADRDR